MAEEAARARPRFNMDPGAKKILTDVPAPPAQAVTPSAPPARQQLPVKQAPSYALSGARLEQEIEDFFQRSQLTRKEQEARQKVMHKVQLAIAERPRKDNIRTPSNGYTVHCFGSTLTGIDVSGSDLDLCIVDHDKEHGWLNMPRKSELPALYNMNSLAYVLRRKGFADIQAISGAGVPIVKFSANINGFDINADANCNEQLGLLNSQLIKAYCDLAPMIRRIIVFIKHWAKSRDLNDPASKNGPASLNSYTFTLMLLAYLMHVGVLPNLQAVDRTADLRRQYFWSRPRDWNRKGVKHDVTWAKPLNTDAAKATTVSLRAAVEGFFDFYATDFDSSEFIVSIVRGGIAKRSSGGEPVRTRHASNSPLPPEARYEDDDEDIIYEGDPQLARHATLATTQEEEDAEAMLDEASYSEDDELPSPEKAKDYTWSHPFICQDPFMLSRNTATNVEPRTWDRILGEIRRAHELIRSGASLDEICQDVRNEDAYIAAQAERDAGKRPQNKQYTPRAPRQAAPPKAPRVQLGPPQQQQMGAERQGGMPGAAMPWGINRPPPANGPQAYSREQMLGMRQPHPLPQPPQQRMPVAPPPVTPSEPGELIYAPRKPSRRPKGKGKAAQPAQPQADPAIQLTGLTIN